MAPLHRKYAIRAEVGSCKRWSTFGVRSPLQAVQQPSYWTQTGQRIRCGGFAISGCTGSSQQGRVRWPTRQLFPSAKDYGDKVRFQIIMFIEDET